MQIKAIPTRYKGYHFRSRLEARWAVFFDALGVDWEYEPEGFELPSGLYLPDFRVSYPQQKNCWFECKGSLEDVSDAEWARMIEFQNADNLIVLDGVPDVRLYQTPTEICDVDPETAHTRPYKAGKYVQEYTRGGFALWSYKERLWWDEYENFFEAGFDMGGWAVAQAVAKARSARFEHGQRGAT
jgi:hypothetical protein